MTIYETLTTSDLEAIVACVGKNRFDNSFRKKIEGKFCVYCGEIASGYDHFPPATSTPVGLLLPSCNECNYIAGTEFGYDFVSRAAYVNSKLRRKYASFINNPSWSEDELRSLGHSLRTGVKEWQTIRTIMLDRIAWNAISYLSSIDHNNYFAQFDARTHTIIKSERLSCESIEPQKTEKVEYIQTKKMYKLTLVCASCRNEFGSNRIDRKYCNKCKCGGSRKRVNG